MAPQNAMAFVPELILLVGALGLFALMLNTSGARQARWVAMAAGFAAGTASLVTLGSDTVLFDGAYRVDGFSQVLKAIVCFGYVLVLWGSGDLPDIRAEVKGEYYFLMTLSVAGLAMLMSSVDVLTLVIALELSSFPLYLLVPMRREREGQRVQMESAIKYIVFGIAANGIMLFGLSYLYAMTGSTSLPEMFARLQPMLGVPLVLAGLGMALCGLYYKLAVFPFHFWSPDVYQGASNETTSFIATLPKVGAVAVFVRFVTLAAPGETGVATMLAVLAGASMLYGNLIALVQKDLKRLLAFSGIAHGGYALIGFVSLDQAGYAAALYYVTAYMAMALAAFVVICKLSKDGANVSIQDVAGLHRRSPLLALTLGVGMFALAGIPPFPGFAGKLALLTAALSKGHLALVIFAVLNSAIAVYYYLAVVKEAYFASGEEQPAIMLGAGPKGLCWVLITAITALGIFPSPFLNHMSGSVAHVNRPLFVAPRLSTERGPDFGEEPRVLESGAGSRDRDEAIVRRTLLGVRIATESGVGPWLQGAIGPGGAAVAGRIAGDQEIPAMAE